VALTFENLEAGGSGAAASGQERLEQQQLGQQQLHSAPGPEMQKVLG